MKLQIALDDISLEDALRLVESIRKDIDIIEVGTPMAIQYGMEAVRRMKQAFPEKEVLADLKIMDAGEYEASEAFEAGAVATLSSKKEEYEGACIYVEDTLQELRYVRHLVFRVWQYTLVWTSRQPEEHRWMI